MAALTSSDHYHETVPTADLPAEVRRYAPPPRRGERQSAERPSVERQAAERQAPERQESSEPFVRRAPSIAPEQALIPAPTAIPAAEATTPAPTLTSAADLHRLMEKRSRELGSTIGVMEQQRQHLRSIEKQRELNGKEFAGAVDSYKEAARLLKEATANPEQLADIEHLSTGNRKALDHLEASVAALVSNFQYWRTSWLQYQQTCARTKELKLEMAATEPMTDA